MSPQEFEKVLQGVEDAFYPALQAAVRVVREGQGLSQEVAPGEAPPCVTVCVVAGVLAGRILGRTQDSAARMAGAGAFVESSGEDPQTMLSRLLLLFTPLDDQPSPQQELVLN